MTGIFIARIDLPCGWRIVISESKGSARRLAAHGF